MLCAIILARTPVGIGKMQNGHTDNIFQLLLADMYLAPSLVIRDACQNRMTDGVATDIHAALMHLADVIRTHHQILRQARTRYLRQPFRLCRPLYGF